MNKNLLTYQNDYDTENNITSVLRQKNDDTLLTLQDILNHLKPSNILDFGCGDGHYHKYFKENITGIDKIQKTKSSKENDKIYTSLNQIKTSFDFIFSLETLEHTERPELILEELVNTKLTNNGYVFIVVPNINTLDDKLNNINQAIYNPELKQYTQGRWNSTHLRFFDIPSLIGLFESVNLKIVNTGGCNFLTSQFFKTMTEDLNLDYSETCLKLQKNFSYYAPSIYILGQKL